MIPDIVYQFIKQAKLSKKEKKQILDAAIKYYDNNDPDDPKHRWDHMLDVMDVAKKIRGRDLDKDEFGMIAFHDSGYKHPKGYAYSKSRHPMFGAKIFRKEGPKLGYSPEEIKRIAKVIAYHNHKPDYSSSPLLKDDMQMLLFSADEGTPIDLKDDAKMYYVKGRSGVYKGVDPKSKDFIKQLVAKVKTFGNYSKLKRLKYYNDAYPGYLQSKYDFWQSPDLEKYYKELDKKDKKKEKKASVDISDIVNAYKEQYGFDLSHMKGKHSKKPRYNNGKVAKDIPVESYGGSWAKNNTIYLNPDMDAVAKYYGLDNTDDLRKTIVAHELAHEIYNKQATKEYIKKIVNEAKKKKFTTAYLKTVPDHKIDEETFCEYLANGLSKKASKLYTYVDPDADLSLGILSARQAPEDILLRRYPGRAKNKKELLKLMQERLDDKDRPSLIYALSEPIPDRATEKLRRFRDARKLVSYDTDDIKDLIKILKRNYRKPPSEVKDVERKKYIQWGRKPKDGGAFFYAPVYKLLTESGRIPPEILKEE